MSFFNSLTQKTCISIYIMVKWWIWILTSDQRSEVNLWPLRGQIKKIMSFLNFLTQNTYISIYITVKWWIWIFNLWSEVRGQLVASERSNKKNSAIFELLDPKNLCFNIHHDKIMALDFWPLIRGQRSIGGLWEVKSKK